MKRLSELLPGERRAVYPSLAGKRVLVTGGGSGIGGGLVQEFCRQGADVSYFDLAPGKDKPAYFHQVDLTDIPATQAAIARLIAEGGAFDVLVNNAANDDRHKIDEITPAYWDERMAVNLRHQFFASQAVLPAMRRAGGGAIVNFGSISWHLALPDLLLYQTAKAAIEGLTRAMARDLGRDGIRVNAVIPGNVQTPRQERWYTAEGEAELVAAQCLDGRIQPADVAALVLFLASDDARMCTGHEYFVDAGWR
jgi:NAD(P)-dependent dehydrogenase (short-subunit alcohol dehydrogenase family)